MCHAVLLLDLWGRQLVITAKLELAIDDVVNGISAPVHRVVGAAARSATAAPLVRENDFGAVVVERGRVPVGKALVDDFVHARRIQRIGDVEDDAVARARAAGNPAFGKHGDVVALVGNTGVLRVVTVVAALPQAGQPARFGIGKYGGLLNDARLGRIVNRDLDDVDAEQCGSFVTGNVADTAFQLFPITHAKRCRSCRR